MPTHAFQLVGGDPALDFLNTISDWSADEARDYLPDLQEALRFAVEAGVLTRAEAQRVATRPPGSELTRLRELRTRLERMLRSAVADRVPAAADLDALARDAGDAARAARLRASRGRLLRVIDVDAAGPAALRWRIIDAAIALLTSERMERVKACPGCGWFFLDVSRNQSRRWCSMAMCGNSAKARSYYRRVRQRSAAKRGRPNAGTGAGSRRTPAETRD